MVGKLWKNGDINKPTMNRKFCWLCHNLITEENELSGGSGLCKSCAENSATENDSLRLKRAAVVGHDRAQALAAMPKQDYDFTKIGRKYCRSCGKMMTVENKKYGINPDGSINEELCRPCIEYYEEFTFGSFPTLNYFMLHLFFLNKDDGNLRRDGQGAVVVTPPRPPDPIARSIPAIIGVTSVLVLFVYILTHPLHLIINEEILSGIRLIFTLVAGFFVFHLFFPQR